MKSTLVSIGIVSALAVACNPLLGWEDPYTEAKSDLSTEDAGGTQEDGATNPSPTGDDAGAKAACLVDNDCAAWLDNAKPSPAKCAEAYCEGGTCKARPVDADGDGHRVAKCEVSGIAFTKGTDCDDADKDFYPDKTRECSELPDGTKITYPVSPPTGSCKKGTQACKSDGTIGACTNAVAPKDKDTCVNGNDDSCDGTPNKDCACKLGETRTCGTCGTGIQTCSDPGTGPVWGTCQNGQPANYGTSCGSCGGTIKCDGTCSVPTPANYNQNCGSCGGKIQCNGSCSIGTPASYGQSCNAGCGTIQCSGACSNTTSNVGASCGPAGGGCGTKQCNGTCNGASITRLKYSASGSFSCCSVNQTKSYGGTCSGAGWAHQTCTVTKTSGGGTVYVESQGNCGCTVREQNAVLEGATYDVAIYERSICTTP